MPAKRKNIVTYNGQTSVEYYDATDTLLFGLVSRADGGATITENYGANWTFAGGSKSYVTGIRHVTEQYNSSWQLATASISYTDQNARTIIEHYGAGWSFTGGSISYQANGRSIVETYDAAWHLVSATITYDAGTSHYVEHYGGSWNLTGASQSYSGNGGLYTQYYNSAWSMTSAAFETVDGAGVGTTTFYDAQWHATGTNHDPNNITVSTATLNDLAIPGENVATLFAQDQDAGETFQFRLVADANGATFDNALFTIAGNTLKLAPNSFLDAASDPVVHVNVRVTDAHGGSFDKQLTFTVGTPPQTGPAIAIAHTSVLENAAGASIGALSISGWDQPDLTLSVYRTDGNGQVLVQGGLPVLDERFAVVGGQLRLAQGVALDYEAQSSVQVMLRASSSTGFYKDQPVTVTVADVNPWEGKNYGVIGDSITDWNFYQQMVSEHMDAPLVFNDGIPGRWMTDALINLDGGHELDDIDLLTIFLGTNDYGGHHTLGSYTDALTAGTFYADTRKTIETILAYKPSIELVMVTPTVRGNYPGQPVNPAPNNTGAYLWQYVDAIKQVAGDYGVTVIDLYTQSGITMDNLSTYTYDNLHPNYQGHELISKVMINAFELL